MRWCAHHGYWQGRDSAGDIGDGRGVISEGKEEMGHAETRRTRRGLCHCWQGRDRAENVGDGWGVGSEGKLQTSEV
ncbi:hypothetical protein KKE26_03935 [bacterium]|nr:hypothetical protein [bacterium]